MMSEHEHPNVETLSAWIDGDLEPAEAAATASHVEACERCTRTADELRSIVTAAGALESTLPEEDLWPQVRARLHDAHPFPWLVLLAGVAAGVLAVLAAGALRGDASSELGSSGGARYVLILHERPGHFADATPEEVDAVVARYRSWAEGLRERGKLESGEKLAPQEGYRLRTDDSATTVTPRNEPGGVAGYFVIHARDEAEALELTRGCPHLELGGEIELRRIEET